MNYLKEQLIKRNMTQKELATRVGVTETTISRYISRKRKISLENCCKIANILEINLDEFIKGIWEVN